MASSKRGRRTACPRRAARVVLLGATFGVAVSSACTNREVESVLSAPEWAKSLLLLREKGGRVVGDAFDIEDEAAIHVVVDDDHKGSDRVALNALFYDRSPDELGLGVGRLRDDLEGRANEPPPVFDVAYGAVFRGGASNGWTEISALEPPFSTFRFAHADAVARCAERGGCLLDATDVLSCSVPCPAPSEIEDVEPTRAPDLLPCPEGWRVAETGSPPESVATVCDPWSSGALAECSVGELLLPGTPTCVAVGSSCDADGFPASLPAGRPVFYVSSGAPPDGDGSRGRPFRTIAAALDAAIVPGGVIAVGVGDYIESIGLRGDVLIQGACPGGTRLALATPDGALSIEQGAQVTLRDLTLVDSAIVVSGEGTAVEMEQIIVQTAPTAGLVARAGARLETFRVLVERPAGAGVSLGRGAVAKLRDTSVNRALGAGLVAESARLELAGTLVRDTLGYPEAGAIGSGIVATTSTVVVEESAVVGSAGAAIEAWAFSALTVSDSVLQGARSSATVPGQDIFQRDGVRIGEGVRAVVTRTAVLGMEGDGVWLGPGVHAVFEDVVVDALVSHPAHGWVSAGASFDARRVHIAHPREDGMVLSEGSVAALEDVRIFGPSDCATNRCVGLDVSPKALVLGQRIFVASNSGRAMTLGGEVALTDVHVIGDLDTARPGLGAEEAIRLRAGAQVRMTRALVEKCSNSAFRSTPGSLELRDLRVSASAAAIRLGVGSTADVARFRFQDLRQLAVEVTDVEDSTSIFVDGEVARTPIGVFLPSHEFTPRVFTRVRFVDVETYFSYSSSTGE
ncbi:MAG: hypothetical protein IPK13_23495 [Deltaproteobacteria bacterium]|nr:hypothetical protein [Deltaproteobacteria bacterium]